MFSFRQKIFIYYVIVFLVFIIVMFPLISNWVEKLVIQTMETRALELIEQIKDAPNNEALIRRLKAQKGSVFFRVSIIDSEHKVLYDSHMKRILGPKFSQEYVVDHPEVNQAFIEGKGYHEEFSKLLNHKFSYFAKRFDFHGKTYVLRTAFPYQYISQLIHDFEIGFLGFATAMLLLFSLMTWFIINYLTKPIQHIINAVKPYQEGKETHLPDIDMSTIKSQGDFAQLAMTLNSLSAKIQSHIDSLTHERNEKEAILESLVEGVIAVDDKLKISYVNNMATKLIPINKDYIGESFHTVKQESFYDLLQSCQQKKTALSETIHIITDGKRSILDIVASPKKGNGGAILVLQDKTAHHKIAEMRRDFIANASHELKTPITIIRGFAEALHDNPNLPRNVQEEATKKIVRNCQRMANLIKNLLTLADIENIPSSRLIECDVNALVQQCSSTLLEVFPEVQISIEKPEDRDVTLIADTSLLELAIMNLILNAAKYSPKPAQIHITLTDDDKNVNISVSDKGIGIPAADQEHIFDRFYTVDKAHSQKMGGSGLGLSIVKTIIEKHFGTISLKSDLGKGTTFTIILPKREYDDEENVKSPNSINRLS
ncbi:MAG: PAS domain-containing protein [Parachlamydiaceae bacterium]|nr:PAS domain-containing protein [Parachlamydiaceae bacterium]